MIKATTKSGAELVIQYGFFSRRGQIYGKYFGLKNIDRDEAVRAEDQWVYIHDQPFADVPEVGKLLYVSHKDWWYLSTEIQTVEVIDD